MYKKATCGYQNATCGYQESSKITASVQSIFVIPRHNLKNPPYRSRKSVRRLNNCAKSSPCAFDFFHTLISLFIIPITYISNFINNPIIPNLPFGLTRP